MKARIAFLAALVAIFTWGCSLVVGSLDECATDGDCASKGAGLTCVDALCVSTSTDAGPVDAGPVDAGPVDAGPVDAGPDVLRDPACQVVLGDASAADAIHFGAILPKTKSDGSPDSRGVMREHGLQLVIDGLNTQYQGVGQRKLVLRVCDDKSNAATASAQAQALIDEGAVVLFTAGSGETLAAAGPAVPAGVVVMSVSATSSQIGSAGLLSDGGAKLVWSTAPSDDLQGRVLAQVLVDAGYSAPGAIYRSDVYGTGLKNTLTTALASDGSAVLDATLFNPRYADGGLDVTGAISHFASAQPAAMVLIGFPDESDAILEAWSGAGYAEPAWFFTDASRDTALWKDLDGGLARLTGARGTGPSTAGASTLEYSDFQGQFVAAFPGVDLNSDSFVPNAYDAAMLIALGVDYAQIHGGLSGAGIATGLTQVSDTTLTPPDSLLSISNFTTLTAAFTQGKKLNVQGASGELDFDPATGVAPGPIDIWTIAPDGGLVTEATVQP